MRTFKTGAIFGPPCMRDRLLGI